MEGMQYTFSVTTVVTYTIAVCVIDQTNNSSNQQSTVLKYGSNSNVEHFFEDVKSKMYYSNSQNMWSL